MNLCLRVPVFARECWCKCATVHVDMFARLFLTQFRYSPSIVPNQSHKILSEMLGLLGPFETDVNPTFDYSAIQEFHYIKWSTNHIAVGAESICFRNRHISLFQSMYDPVFPLNLMGCLGKQLSWRFFAQHVFCAISSSQLIGWIGLTKTELRKLAGVNRNNLEISIPA